MIDIAALHRVEERLSCRFIFMLTQLCVQAAEVFRPKIDELVAAEIRFEAFNILLLAHERGLRRLDRFLLRIAPPSVGRVTHRDDKQITVSAFSDTCHVVIPPVSLSTAEIL